MANLKYGTKSKNHGEDQIRDGTLRRGTEHYRAVLAEDDVREIKRLYDSERDGNRHGQSKRRYTEPVLAEMFDVSRGTINDILNNRTWKHVDLEEQNV